MRAYGRKSMSDAQLDKCEYLERKIKAVYGESLPLDKLDQLDNIEFHPDLIQEGWNDGKGEGSLYSRGYDKINWDA